MTRIGSGGPTRQPIDEWKPAGLSMRWGDLGALRTADEFVDEWNQQLLMRWPMIPVR